MFLPRCASNPPGLDIYSSTRRCGPSWGMPDESGRLDTLLDESDPFVA